MMQSIDGVLDKETRRQAMHDTRLTEEQFRFLLEGAVPVFRERTIRDAFPVRVINDPGVLESRHSEVEDMSDAQHGMRGTGGTSDRVDYSFNDEPAYAIWHNGEVPWRIMQAAQRANEVNILRDTGDAIGEIIVEKENEMLVSGLGPVTGITGSSNLQTFTGGNWTNASEAYDDIIKATQDKLRQKNAPVETAALLVHPSRHADLSRTFSNTDVAQLEGGSTSVQEFLPGGVYVNTNVPTDKAYVYSRSPSVVEYRVYQDLTMVPLPRIDEDERVRGRVIGALHLKREAGIVEVQSITS